MTARRARGTRPAGSAGASASGTAKTADGKVRLQKLLALAGLGSRRACERWVEEGRVSVDGKVAKLGDNADPATQRIDLDGERLILDRPAYWMVNKPKGVLTTLSDPEGRDTVVGLLPKGIGRVFPVGRLDIDTEGLVLLTNDGALTHALLHPSLGSEREYEVVVRGELDDKRRGRLERGVRLDDGLTAPARVEKARYDEDSDTTRFRLVLKEGRKRQIRRSLMALRRPVKRLRRVRMGPIRLGRLHRGKARELTATEIADLRRHVRDLDKRKASGEAARTSRARRASTRSTRSRSGPDDARAARGTPSRGTGKPEGRSSARSSGRPTGKSTRKATGRSGGKPTGKPSRKPTGKPGRKSSRKKSARKPGSGTRGSRPRGGGGSRRPKR